MGTVSLLIEWSWLPPARTSGQCSLETCLRNFDHGINLQAVVMYAYNAAFNLSADRMPLLMVAA